MTEETKVRTQFLPVKLTAAEVTIRTKELINEEAVLHDAETRLESFVEAAKETKKGIENEVSDARQQIHHLATVVREKSEKRDVPVVEEPDFANGCVNTVRTDTGEIISTRGMTPAEHQRSLFQATGKEAEA